jgi:hypothetical protein
MTKVKESSQGKKFSKLSTKQLSEFQGGRIVVSDHNFFGHTWTTTRMYNDFDGERYSTCRSSDYDGADKGRA